LAVFSILLKTSSGTGVPLRRQTKKVPTEKATKAFAALNKFLSSFIDGVRDVPLKKD
jgi:hypothetical protein